MPNHIPCRLAVIACLVIATPTVASSSPASILLKQLGKFAAGESSEATGKMLSKEAGQSLAKRVGGRLAQDGGEQAVQSAGRLVAGGGANVMRALDNAADPVALVRVLSDLPTRDLAVASARLAAGKTGRELSELAGKHGVKTLTTELAHPGLAVKYVGRLGDEGAAVATRLTTDQATMLAKHVDDIAELPPPLRTSLLDKVVSQPERFTAAMGRFVADNPGKILFTAAATTAIVTAPEQFLGTTMPDGTVAPGMIERTVFGIADRTITPLAKGLVAIFLTALAIFTAIVLLRFYRRTSVRTDAHDAQRFSDETPAANNDSLPT